MNGDKAEEFEKLIDDKTKAIFLESIGNPRYNVPDFEVIVKVAHAQGVPVVVWKASTTVFYLSCQNLNLKIGI